MWVTAPDLGPGNNLRPLGPSGWLCWLFAIKKKKSLYQNCWYSLGISSRGKQPAAFPKQNLPQNTLIQGVLNEWPPRAIDLGREVKGEPQFRPRGEYSKWAGARSRHIGEAGHVTPTSNAQGRCHGLGCILLPFSPLSLNVYATGCSRCSTAASVREAFVRFLPLTLLRMSDPSPHSSLRQKRGSRILCIFHDQTSHHQMGFFKGIIPIFLKDKIYGLKVMATNLIKWGLISPETFSQLAKSPRHSWRVNSPRQKRIKSAQRHKNTQWAPHPFSFSSDSHPGQGILVRPLSSPFPLLVSMLSRTPSLPMLVSARTLTWSCSSPLRISVFSWFLKNWVNVRFVTRH